MQTGEQTEALPDYKGTDGLPSQDQVPNTTPVSVDRRRRLRLPVLTVYRAANGTTGPGSTTGGPCTSQT